MRNRSQTSYAQPSERKKLRYACRPFGTNSLKEGTVWRVDPLLSNDRETIKQRPVNSNRGMVFSAWSAPMAAHATIDSATGEPCFLCVLWRDLISWTVVVEWSEAVGEWVTGLLCFSPCELLLLELVAEARGRFGNRGRGTSSVGSRCHVTASGD
jgi:hypothetical protein